ncbi:hypothetical protein [Pararhodospirillum oryzae]|uniref:Uncharacterized protein n=1 Tax=Pararhodospirillum oryzae TaxID=478448 RepID=A0A512H3C4_9PROT|nr:hypothetical protein [Pararhodospirillum oryzae]GEO79966.1 hypothetical protein ROR02_00970 [Pararhodospirillum oryzae]
MSGGASDDDAAAVWALALATLEAAETWEGLRADLERHGVLRRLASDQRQALAERWEARVVRQWDDQTLAGELRFWARGGDRHAHPLGFQAPRPAVLVAEAGHRGWFVRILSGGRVVVNAPETEPMVLFVGTQEP